MVQTNTKYLCPDKVLFSASQGDAKRKPPEPVVAMLMLVWYQVRNLRSCMRRISDGVWSMIDNTSEFVPPSVVWNTWASTGGRGGHTWQVNCEFVESF